MLYVTVKTLDSRDHIFDNICDTLTVKQFKELIADRVGVDAERQRLIYCGRVMQDGLTLQAYNINNKVIHLVQRAPPQPPQAPATTGGEPSDATTTASSGGPRSNTRQQTGEGINRRPPSSGGGPFRFQGFGRMGGGGSGSHGGMGAAMFMNGSSGGVGGVLDTNNTLNVVSNRSSSDIRLSNIYRLMNEVRTIIQYTLPPLFHQINLTHDTLNSVRFVDPNEDRVSNTPPDASVMVPAELLDEINGVSRADDDGIRVFATPPSTSESEETVTDPPPTEAGGESTANIRQPPPAAAAERTTSSSNERRRRPPLVRPPNPPIHQLPSAMSHYHSLYGNFRIMWTAFQESHIQPDTCRNDPHAEVVGRIFHLLSSAMHLLGHALHGLSDLQLDYEGRIRNLSWTPDRRLVLHAPPFVAQQVIVPVGTVSISTSSSEDGPSRPLPPPTTSPPSFGEGGNGVTTTMSDSGRGNSTGASSTQSVTTTTPSTGPISSSVPTISSSNPSSTDAANVAASIQNMMTSVMNQALSRSGMNNGSGDSNSNHFYIAEPPSINSFATRAAMGPSVSNVNPSSQQGGVSSDNSSSVRGGGARPMRGGGGARDRPPIRMRSEFTFGGGGGPSTVGFGGSSRSPIGGRSFDPFLKCSSHHLANSSRGGWHRSRDRVGARGAQRQSSSSSTRAPAAATGEGGTRDDNRRRISSLPPNESGDREGRQSHDNRPPFSLDQSLQSVVSGFMQDILNNNNRTNENEGGPTNNSDDGNVIGEGLNGVSNFVDVLSQIQSSVTSALEDGQMSTEGERQRRGAAVGGGGGGNSPPSLADLFQQIPLFASLSESMMNGEEGGGDDDEDQDLFAQMLQHASTSLTLPDYVALAGIGSMSDSSRVNINRMQNSLRTFLIRAFLDDNGSGSCEVPSVLSTLTPSEQSTLASRMIHEERADGETTCDSLHQQIVRVSERIRTCGGLREGIDFVATVDCFLQSRLEQLFKTIFTDYSIGSSSSFADDLAPNLQSFISEMLELCVECFEEDSVQSNIDAIITDRLNALITPSGSGSQRGASFVESGGDRSGVGSVIRVPAPLHTWIVSSSLGHVRVMVGNIVSRRADMMCDDSTSTAHEVRRYLNYTTYTNGGGEETTTVDNNSNSQLASSGDESRYDTPSSSPRTSKKKGDSTTSKDNQSNSTISAPQSTDERKQQQQGDGDKDSENGWKSEMPEEWIPIISEDATVDATPQAPFSDAYISTQPAKRRKMVGESKGGGPSGSTVSHVFSQILSKTLRDTVSSSCGEVERERVVREGRENDQLMEEMEEQMCEDVFQRISRDAEFQDSANSVTQDDRFCEAKAFVQQRRKGNDDHSK